MIRYLMMRCGMTSKRSEVVIGYKTDEQSARKAVADARRVDNQIKNNAIASVVKESQIASAQFDQLSGALKKTTLEAQGGLKDLAQLAAGIGLLSGSDMGMAVTTVITLADSLKSLGGLQAGIKALPQAVGMLSSSLGLVGLGLGAVAGLTAIVIGELAGELDNAKKAGEAYAQALIETNKAVSDATISLAKGDADSVIKELKRVQDERLRAIVTEQGLRERQQKAGDALRKETEIASEGIVVLAEQIAFLNPNVAEARALYDKLTDELKNTASETVGLALTQRELTDQLLRYGFTIEEIEIAIAKLDEVSTSANESLRELSQGLISQVEAQRARVLMEADLLAQSEEALRSRNLALMRDVNANNEAIRTLRASGDTSEEVAKKIKEYENANLDLMKTIGFITSSALPNAIQKAQRELQKADALQTQADTITATKKFNEDMKRLNEDNQKSLLAIEQKRTDTLLAIAKRYADDVARAQARFEESLASQQIKFSQDEIKSRTRAFEAEIDASRKHYQALEDISTQAKRDEQDSLRALDFKGAFEARRERNRAIEDEQKKFAREAEDRKINQDRERIERLNAYAQAQADARANYQRELQTARQAQAQAQADARMAHEADLQNLRNANTQRLRALQGAYAEELRLARQTSAQRLAIQAQIDAQLLAQAQRFLSSSLFRASSTGGRQATQSATSAGRQTTSARGGNVNSGGRGVQIVVNESTNPRRTAQQIRSIINSGGR